MIYKMISLKRSCMDYGFYFYEEVLDYDRQDIGEYIHLGHVAFIYATSNSNPWKAKIIELQKEEIAKEIKQLQEFIVKLEEIKNV